MNIRSSCDLGGRVSEERLHRAKRSSYCVQQRRVRMPQRMPTDLWNLQLFANRIKLTIPEISTTERGSFRRAEDKGFWLRCSWSDTRKDLHSLGTQRHNAIAETGLGFVEMPFVQRAAYTKESSLQVDILPAQGQQFADSKAG